MAERRLEIILARHGETDGHTLPRYRGDPPLTGTGREQARLLADALEGRGIDQIYSSAMLRAKQTAAPLADALGMQVVAVPGLNEIAQGEFPGNEAAGRTRPMSEFAEWGGESATDFSTRIKTAFGTVTEAITGDGVRAAFFLHDGVLNAILDSIEGVEPDGYVRTLFFNGSITELSLRPGDGWSIGSTNEISHLPVTLLTPRSLLSG